MTRVFGVLTVLAMLAGSVQGGECGGCRVACCSAPCQTWCAPAAVAAPQCQTVQRTIMVPTWTTETQVVNSTEYRQEARQRTVTVYQTVPETKRGARTINYCEQETRVRQERYTVTKPIWVDQIQNYTVNVPYTEMRTGTRYVCRTVWEDVPQNYTVMVPHVEMRTGTRCVSHRVAETVLVNQCVDQGYFEERVSYGHAARCGGYGPAACSPCGSCGHSGGCGNGCGNGCGHTGGCGAGCGYAPVCTTTCRVWVPNIVTIQVPHTTHRWVTSQEQYEYPVTVCHAETRTQVVKVARQVTEPQTYEYPVTLCRAEPRTRTVKVCQYINEELVRDVPYTVSVPKSRVEEYDYTVYNSVPVEKVETYTVCVPYPVSREVQVQVCRMIPQVVTVAVPCAAPCGGGCGSCGGCGGY